MDTWIKWYYDIKINKIYKYKPPYIIFDGLAERALLQNIASWITEEKDCDNN